MTDLTSRDFTQASDPFGLFAAWLDEAGASEPNDPNAMALATVDAAGLPDIRMVLLKGWDAQGFVFYTNTLSAKGQELAANPRAALLFHWKSLRRQVRIRGTVAPATEAEADAYFASRPQQSRYASAASLQSRPVASRAALEAAVATMAERYPAGDLPRPAHWAGYRVTPSAIEFWQDGAHRIHDRVLFEPAGHGWSGTRLYP